MKRLTNVVRGLQLNNFIVLLFWLACVAVSLRNGGSYVLALAENDDANDITSAHSVAQMFDLNNFAGVLHDTKGGKWMDGSGFYFATQQFLETFEYAVTLTDEYLYWYVANNSITKGVNQEILYKFPKLLDDILRNHPLAISNQLIYDTVLKYPQLANNIIALKFSDGSSIS